MPANTTNAAPLQNTRQMIVLNRAYNDLDIQLPLIEAFAKTKEWSIRIIGYPCDGYLGHPQAHEAQIYFSKTYPHVSFETLLDHPQAPIFLKLLYKAERILLSKKLNAEKTGAILQHILKGPYVLVLKMLFKYFTGPMEWLDRVTEDWNPESILIDEAFVQPGRSAVIDRILPALQQKGSHIHVIQTGQTTYSDPNPNKNQSDAPKKLSKASSAQRFFVPSILDQKSVSTNFPNENPEVHGNIRMDKEWVEKLHTDILSNEIYDRDSLFANLPDGKPKVVFMLSKLGYGIKLDEMKASIKAVAQMQDVACAIKPHTRGMKFDFMSQKEIEACAVVPQIPSTLLIEWADIVLFTGSSIAFHALIKGKRAGFLQNAQQLETCFDSGKACDKFDSVEELTAFLQDWCYKGEPKLSKAVQKERAQWITDNVHGGLKNGLTATHYKDIILADLDAQNTKRKTA